MTVKSTEEELHGTKNALAAVVIELQLVQREFRELIILMRGDGSNDKPGVLIELDRLKQAKNNTDKTFWVVVSTAIGLVGKIIIDFFAHNQKP